MRKLKVILIVALILQILLLILLPFTAWPEMVAWPYLMLYGWLPYRDIAIAHTPLLLVDLAVFYKIFGIGLFQLKIYTWIWILLADFLVYHIARKFWNAKTAILTLLLYVPLQIIYEGNGLWFDFALAPLALLIFYSIKKSEFFWTGVWLGLAIFTKQTAFWLIIPLGIYILRNFKFKSFKKVINLSEGFLSVTLFVLITAAIFKILPDFLEWTVRFGAFYLPGAKGQVLFPTLRQLLVSFFPFVILTPLVFRGKKRDLDLIIWTFFAGLGIYPRFELFHFQPALPFLSIGAGVVTMNIFRKQKTIYKIAIIVYIIIVLFLSVRFVVRSWGKEDRFYGQQEIDAASFVEASVKPGEEIYVFNYWDSIYAMTGTLPATRPLVPFLPWYLEYDNLKEEIINGLMFDIPEIVVNLHFLEDLLRSYSIREIDMLLQRYYTLSFNKGHGHIYSLNK